MYVPNGNDDTVSVVDGATCNAIVTSGCDQSAPTVAVGSYPVWAALDGKNHTLYVANVGDNTMSVVNTATCNSGSDLRLRAEPASSRRRQRA